MKGPVHQNGKHDSGFALFVVLSFLMLAAAVTTPFLTGARIEALVTRNNSQTTRDKVLLRGILEVSGLRYFERYQQASAKPVRHVECRLNNLDLAIFFQDHSGLIDLNAASEDVLAMGMESFGLPKETIAKLVTEVVRFRSVESSATMGANAKAPHGGYKHALFEHVSELSDLFTDAASPVLEFDKAFTVHSGTGTVDEMAASSQLSAAIARRAANDRYFLVNDARRTNAVTVSMTMRRENQHQLYGKAIIGRGQNGIGIKFLGPIVWEVQPSQQTFDPSHSSTECDGFFDRQLLQTLQEAAS